MAKKRFIAVSVRQMVAERANWRCEYCQSPENMAPQSFTLEHIVPIDYFCLYKPVGFNVLLYQIFGEPNF